ncbi:MAG: hypothetical protein M0Z54_12500 [Thermaerobacter sp.]|nr:hypothetical protein [Thermaerobacter sp.]
MRHVSFKHLNRHAKNIAQKELVRVLADAALEWYGIDSSPIVQGLPSNVPRVAAHEAVVDSVFLADDGHLVHLEFQSTPEPDRYRFLGYASALATTHRAPVQVVVYLTGRTPPPRCSTHAVSGFRRSLSSSGRGTASRWRSGCTAWWTADRRGTVPACWASRTGPLCAIRGDAVGARDLGGQDGRRAAP